MWCLETIVSVNEKLGEGKSLREAYLETGCHVPVWVPKNVTPSELKFTQNESASLNDNHRNGPRYR